MKITFNSLNGAVTISVITLLAELWRAFIDFQYEYSDFLNNSKSGTIVALLYTILFAAWTWALVGTIRGNRTSLITAIIINLLFLIAIPIGTLVVYCPSPCSTLWPIMELANWINLILGIFATIALALQLRHIQSREGYNTVNKV